MVEGFHYIMLKKFKIRVLEKIIIDTDIGDDVDDAFAVALALSSSELQILGISMTFGDTETRAKLLDRSAWSAK